MLDLIIVGAGPAGLTAAVYGLRKRLNVLVVAEDLGGKARYRPQVPEGMEHKVIRGAELVERFLHELEYLDFAHRLDRVEKLEGASGGFNLRLKSGETLSARSLLVATGCRMTRLNVPGEQAFLGKGVGYSAVSYGHLYMDRTVLVTGGGLRALRAALDLSFQAAKVYLAGPLGPFLGSEIGRRVKEQEGITLLTDASVVRILGDMAAREAVVRGPDGRETAVPVDGIFIEEELEPRSELCAGLVTLDERGAIMVDLKNRTTRPGIFAAGDVTNTHIEQVLVAIGEGAKASLSAYDYLLSLG
jgi:NADH-dependent peroxiredoxin subunit F